MNKLKIVRRKGSAIQVYSPYDPKFTERMHSLHGTWDKAGFCWWLSDIQLNLVRDAMREIFGKDDLEDRDTVSLILRFTEADGAYRRDYTLYGKVLCHATSKTSGGTAGEDVTYLQGSPESGGSVNNWCSVVPAGSVIRLDNVNCASLDADLLPPGTTREILDESHDDRKAALIREREELMKQVTEIDSLLNNM